MTKFKISVYIHRIILSFFYLEIVFRIKLNHVYLLYVATETATSLPNHRQDRLRHHQRKSYSEGRETLVEFV